MKPLRLLVPLAETTTSLKTLEAVRHFAHSVDCCDVELLNVQTDRGEDWRERQTRAQDFLDRQASLLQSRNVAVTTSLVWGDPVEVILDQARQQRFDFICMTSRAVPSNTTPADSVAARLFHNSPVPIIALPAVALAQTGSQGNRAFYRAPVNLSATLEPEGYKHALNVTVRDLGAKGAELALIQPEEGLPGDGLLVLSLPTRREPLQIATRVVGRQHLIEASGEVQVLHTTFPKINMGQQDAIVAFVNRLRVLEQQQRAVKAPVRIEVITGPRAFAVFKGRTMVVRPDYVWLRMERFAHIEAADVNLRVEGLNGRDKFELEGTVTMVKADGHQFEVEVELDQGTTGHANPGEQLMAFLRQNYPGEAAAPADQAQVLIPRPIREQRREAPVARVATASYSETRVPMRVTRKDDVAVPFSKRVRRAEAEAMETILKPRRKSAPLRSL